MSICKQQLGFMQKRRTTDAIFASKVLLEKKREGQKELKSFFADLEKVYDRKRKVELWFGSEERWSSLRHEETMVKCSGSETEVARISFKVLIVYLN